MRHLSFLPRQFLPAIPSPFNSTHHLAARCPFPNPTRAMAAATARYIYPNLSLSLPLLLLFLLFLLFPPTHTTNPSPLSHPSSPSYVTAFTTVDSQPVAEKLASGLVEKRLAACVSTISNVKSTYRWKGEIVNDTEFLLMIKTRKVLVDGISNYLNENHPYDVPELIVHDIVLGNVAYLDWIDSSTLSPGEVSAE